MIEETWKPVVGFEGRYEVSDLGRIRSLQFRSVGGLSLMKPTKNYAGYHVISLGSNPKRQFRLHVLILEAFVGPRPTGMHGCHGRDDKDDNRLVNLRWDTPKRNIAERQSFDGEKNPNARISDTQREEIRQRLLKGEQAKALAPLYGLTRTRIYQIQRSGAITA
jgi:hypothetical protein